MTETIQYKITNNTDVDRPIEIRQLIYRTSEWDVLDKINVNNVRIDGDQLTVCVSSNANEAMTCSVTIQYIWKEAQSEDVEIGNSTIVSSLPQKKSFIDFLFSSKSTS